MSTTLTRPRRKTSDEAYMDLIRKFPLRPIRTKAEYVRASRMIDRLAVRDEATLDRGESDYLDVLSNLVEAFDEEHHRIDTSGITPLELLEHLLQQSGTTPADLAKLLGCSQPLVSLILNGRRELSKPNIRALANHFKIDAGLFV